MAAERTDTFYQIVHNYFESFFAKINVSSRDVILYVSCFGAGFLAGVIFKRYGKWIVSIGLSVILVLALLQSFDFITVHQDKIRSILGLQEMQGYDVLIARGKEYIVELGTIVVGLLLGFKLG